MSVEELEETIADLSREEFIRLSVWFEVYREQEWDRQIEADVRGGKLDQLIREAKEEYRAGRTPPLP